MFFSLNMQVSNSLLSYRPNIDSRNSMLLKRYDLSLNVRNNVTNLFVFTCLAFVLFLKTAKILVRMLTTKEC